MPRTTLAMGIAFTTLLACKQPEPAPRAELASASEAAPPSAPPLPSDAASTSSTGVAIDDPAPEVVAPPAEPAPEIETHTFAADVDPLLDLLGKGVPDAVEVLAVHEHGRERIVLYRLDVLVQWRAGQPDADELLEPLEELTEACSSSYGEVDVGCVVEGAAKYPSIPAEIAGYHASEADAFELAHVKLESETQGKVLARKRLYEHGYACKAEGEGGCFETKLKVYDMDGDARSEILVVFPLEVPSELEPTNHATAALAFVIDKSDFHVQFATTRKYVDAGGDLSYHEAEFATSFVARDTNADGHADLVLREVGMESRSEEGEDNEVTRTDQSITCPYEFAGDRWVCPSKLGTRVIDGNERVEITRLPLPSPVAVEPGR